MKEAITLSITTLTQFERGTIAYLVNLGKTQQEIATTIGVAKSTINYELHRVIPYNAKLAQLDADQKRKNCGRKTKLTNELETKIINHLKLTLSPSMVARELNIATSSIYNWINRKLMNFDSKQLPDKGIRRARSNETRGIIKVGSSIEERTIEINTRSEFGHWEVDTVLSSRGESKHCLVTFIERKTRLLWAIKMNSRSSEALHEAFKKLHNNFGSTIKSITVDHGKEFSKYREIENDYGIKVFFCHPYSPWERGTNERFNRYLRWFFPKKTNFEKVTEDEVIESLELINNRPLKVCNGLTAIESFKLCLD